MANLITHYEFEGNALDSVGTKHLTVVGASYAAGKISNALQFDGSTTKAAVAGKMAAETAGSVSVWVYPLADVVDTKYRVLHYDWGEYSFGFEAYLYGGSGGGGLSLWITGAMGDGQKTVYTGYDIPINTWTHIVISATGSAWTAYINGIAATLTPEYSGGNAGYWFGSFAGTPPANEKTGVGTVCNWGDGSLTASFYGAIDQFKLFDAVLSSGEITTLSEETSPIDLYYVDLIGSASGNDSFMDNMPVLQESAVGSDAFIDNMPGLNDSASGGDEFTASGPASVSESASGSDAFEWIYARNVTVTDSMFIYEAIETDLSLLISEALSTTDTSTFQICLLLAEYINAIDSLLGQQNLTMSASDTISAVDASDRIMVIAATISEALAIADAPSFIMSVLVADYMVARDATSHNLTGTKTVSDTIAATDEIVASWVLSIAESIAAVDTSTFESNIVITEYLAVRDVLTGNQVSSPAISEAIEIADNAVAEWVLSVAESVASVDTVTPEICVLVADYLAIRGTITASSVSNQSLSESIAMADNAIVELVLGLIESLNIADVLAIGKTIDESLSDRIAVSEILLGLGAFGVTIQDTAGISETVQAIISLLISENLVAADSPSYFKDIYVSLADTLGAADALVASLDVYLSLTDNLIAIDTASNTGVFGVTIQEGIKIDVSIEIDGELFECYVLNTPQFLPSIYSGFNFNSYCEYQGRAFGANATGIFELTGDTDNGAAFHTGVTLHETDFGARNEKRFRKAYMGVSGTVPVMIMETGEGERTVYSIDDKGKVDASRSLHSRDWKLSIADFDTVDSVQLVPVILARSK